MLVSTIKVYDGDLWAHGLFKRGELFDQVASKPKHFAILSRNRMKRQRRPAKGWARVLLIILGTLCVALGILGMFLPVLPTTPFLLLAAICYGRSSETFYQWLITNRWCGRYIRNYREGRGILLKQKIVTIALLWVAIGSTAWFAVSRWWARGLLLGIAIGVTVHLLKMKTYQPETELGSSAIVERPTKRRV